MNNVDGAKSCTSFLASRESGQETIKLKTVAALVRKDWRLYSIDFTGHVPAHFKYGPMIGNVIAFRRFMPGGSIYGEKWVGLHYFNMFIHDPAFWNVFKNTLLLGALSLLFTFPVPIIFAAGAE